MISFLIPAIFFGFGTYSLLRSLMLSRIKTGRGKWSFNAWDETAIRLIVWMGVAYFSYLVTQEWKAYISLPLDQPEREGAISEWLIHGYLFPALWTIIPSQLLWFESIRKSELARFLIGIVLLLDIGFLLRLFFIYQAVGVPDMIPLTPLVPFIKIWTFVMALLVTHIIRVYVFLPKT